MKPILIIGTETIFRSNITEYQTNNPDEVRSGDLCYTQTKKVLKNG